jgi:hypothetical protein
LQQEIRRCSLLAQVPARVVTRRTGDIPSRRDDRGVGRLRAADGSVTGSARASVVARSSLQDVGRRSSQEQIDPRAATDRILLSAAETGIAPGATDQHVLSSSPHEDVVATATADRVSRGGPAQDVIPCRAVDRAGGARPPGTSCRGDLTGPIGGRTAPQNPQQERSHDLWEAMEQVHRLTLFRGA